MSPVEVCALSGVYLIMGENAAGTTISWTSLVIASGPISRAFLTPATIIKSPVMKVSASITQCAAVSISLPPIIPPPHMCTPFNRMDTVYPYLGDSTTCPPTIPSTIGLLYGKNDQYYRKMF